MNNETPAESLQAADAEYVLKWCYESPPCRIPRRIRELAASALGLSPPEPDPTPSSATRLSLLLLEIGSEVQTAEAKHKPLNSPHEAYAVILEELQEFWLEVMRKDEDRRPEAMRLELVQAAAMCIRAIRDVIGER